MYISCGKNFFAMLERMVSVMAVMNGYVMELLTVNFDRNKTSEKSVIPESPSIVAIVACLLLLCPV